MSEPEKIAAQARRVAGAVRRLDTLLQRRVVELLAAGGLLIASILALLWPALVGGHVLLPAALPYTYDPLWQPWAAEMGVREANTILGDQIYQFHPWNVFGRAALAQGRLPLWNPYINGGQPLMANGLAAIFSPFHLAGYLLPLAVSYGVGAALRLFVAGIFTYLYGRTIGLSFSGAVLSMLVFALSGPTVVWLGFPPSHVFVWLPALLWGVERLLAARSLAWAGINGALVGALVLGGQPEQVFLVGIVWAAYVLVRVAWLEGSVWAGLRRHGGRLALAVALGGLLGAIEVLPFVDALRHSAILADRTQSADAALLRTLSGTWQKWPTLVTALLPKYFGREADGSYWYPFSNSIGQNSYTGIVPLALAVAGTFFALRKRDVAQRRWLLVWLAFGAVALGVDLELPIFHAITLVPPFDLIAADRLRFAYAFAAAVLAGAGLDLLVRYGDGIRRWLWRFLIAAAAANLALAAAAYAGFVLFKERVIGFGRAFMEANVGTPYLDQPLEVLYELVEQRYAAKLALLQPGNAVMYLPVLVLLAYGVVRWLRRRYDSPAWGRGVEAYALVALALADLLWAGYGFNESAPREWLARTPEAVSFLQNPSAALVGQPTEQRDESGLFRIHATGLILNPNIGMLYGLSDVRGYDAMASQRYIALVKRLEGHHSIENHSLFVGSSAPLLDLFNVRYTLTKQALPAERWQPVFVDPSGVTVYQNRNALPRGWVVYAAEVVETAEQSLERVLDPAFDARRTVVLEERPAGWSPPETAMPESAPPESAPPESAPRVEFLAYEPEHVRMRVQTEHPGLLVLSDAWMPGWQARVDGAAAPIYVANHAFRAVVVAAGEQTVEFDYLPVSVRAGAVASGTALAGCVVWVVFGWWMRGRSRLSGREA